MHTSPKVSVIIPSFNYGKYLPECIDSVLAQTYRNFEIIVVDDGSSDKSCEILENYRQHFPDKIHFYWHPDHVNKGISSTINLGIEKSVGEYILGIGADDVLHPEILQRQTKFLDDNPDYGMVYCRAQIINGAGEKQSVIMSDPPISGEFLPQLMMGDKIIASTVILRRECLLKIGVFDEELLFSDWDLWIRIAAKYPVGFIPDALVYYRVHGKNVSVRPDLPELNLKNNLAVINSIAKKLPEVNATIIKQAQASIYLRAGLEFLKIGNLDSCFQCIDEVVKLNSLMLTKGPFSVYEFIKVYFLGDLYNIASNNELRIRQISDLFTKFRLPKTLLRHTISNLYLNWGFAYYKMQNIKLSGLYISKAIFNNPSNLLNRGVLSIEFEFIIGSNLANRIRLQLRKPYFVHKSIS
jgi:glycosyltransferase involved in cell wall biosynthesis